MMLLGAAGCTFEDGRGFATVSGTLNTRFAGLDTNAGRVGADGWYKADNSFEFQLGQLRLGIGDIQLTSSGAAQAASSSGTCAFDPANPPAGCSLCHGGHCHCGDALKTYAELQAQVCGSSSGGAGQVLARLTTSQVISLLQAATATLDRCSPSCELEAGQVNELGLPLRSFSLEAMVRDKSVANRLSGQQVALSVVLDLSASTLTATLTEAELLDRDHAHGLVLLVDLPVAATLLDGIDWHTLTRDSSGTRITVSSASNSTAATTLGKGLAATSLKVIVTRTDE